MLFYTNKQLKLIAKVMEIDWTLNRNKNNNVKKGCTSLHQILSYVTLIDILDKVNNNTKILHFKDCIWKHVLLWYTTK